MLSLPAHSVLGARWLFPEGCEVFKFGCDVSRQKSRLIRVQLPTLQPFFDTLLQSPVPGQTSHPETPGSGPVSYTGLIPIADWSVRSWFPHHKMPVAAQVPGPGMLGAQEPTFKPELSAERRGTWFAFHNPSKMAEQSSSSVY